ncbi:hypothetical protein UB31_13235 [Bradyrhizobium sp. LTSP849]|jgi:hypothetical protein|uniref:hypothetical protein n=1 Tax=Bradyrhizobium sp. LTSP849 TaxID=1615890 RepID=UPI0005D1428C|nr:hypothetical protein [Bradyrhizobium sp. LTSP849]KJC50311.1 hypothetical protein UB31_13235 [Bradyrhizobium sp. LTSP849]
MGTVVPKGTAKLSGVLAGATDGKSDSLTPGLELRFTVRLRYGDQDDTIGTVDVVRKILPAVTDRLQPTPDMFLSVIEEAQRKARQRERLYFIGQIVVAVVAISLAMIFILHRLRQMRSPKTKV